ncbi:glutathione hydrolase 1 proenzyme-like isoform X3 [Argonauta hians]
MDNDVVVNTEDIPEEGKVNNKDNDGGDGGGGADGGGADAGGADGGGEDVGDADAGAAEVGAAAVGAAAAGAGADVAVPVVAVPDVDVPDVGGTGAVGAGRDEISEVLIEPKEPTKMFQKRCLMISGGVMLVVLMVALVGVTVYLSLTPEEEQPERCPNTAGEYKHAAVSTDAHTNCSEIGVAILKRGSVVDAAIATILCVGLINLQSCGIGGGHVMTVYIRRDKRFFSILGREIAPGFATEDMFLHGASSLDGGLSIAVPGEILGLWEAHQKFGRLKWKELFQPSIKLCREGYPMSPDTENALKKVTNKVKDHKELHKLLWNNVTNTWKKTGDIIKNPKLANTLERIAEEGADAFYNGSLTESIVADIRDSGGNITAEDLKSYRVRLAPALKFTMFTGHTVHTTTLPTSGPVLIYMFNILNGYTYGSVKVSESDRTLAYHRLIESYKFAYAARSRLGDDLFVANLTELIKNMTNVDYGESIRREIQDDKTFNYKYYRPSFKPHFDSGTSHISVYAPNGDAVGLTSTINTYFGSKVLGTRTGILFNNEMDDFSTSDKPNEFGIPPSPSNRIAPYKMPMSSMAPAIFVDSNGDVTHVIGASGGSRITTGIAYVLAETLWFKKSIAEGINFPRLHHQLIPQYIEMEENFPKDIQEELEAKGHKVHILKMAKSRTQGIVVHNKVVAAAADPRKCGSVDGW